MSELVRIAVHTDGDGQCCPGFGIERILSFFMMDIGEYHPTFRGIARQYLPTCEARREIMPVNSDE